MEFNLIEIIGLAAATLTTSSFLPQVIKIFKTRSTESISLTMYLIFATGVLLWFVYGLYIQSLSIILANAFTFILQVIIIFLKLKNTYQNKK